MGCSYLAPTSGDAINAVRAAVSYNFRVLLQVPEALAVPNPDCNRWHISICRNPFS